MEVNINKGRYILLCHERGVKRQTHLTVSIIHEERIIRWWVTRHTCYNPFGPGNLNSQLPAFRPVPCDKEDHCTQQNGYGVL
jgi:hypothetical protein